MTVDNTRKFKFCGYQKSSYICRNKLVKWT